MKSRFRKIQMRHVLLSCIIVLLLTYQGYRWAQEALPLLESGESPINFLDYFWRWQECAYFVRGINPFDAISGSVVLDEIGVIPPFAGTVPWAYVLGNLLNPGFLPYAVVEGYGKILYCVVPALTAWAVYKYTKDNYFPDDAPYCILLAISIFLPICWRQGITYGNHSIIVSCLIVLTMCYVQKHPVLCGILMAIASVKPQSTGLFFIVLLLMRKFKTVAIAAAIIIAAWVASFMVTGTAPLTMLMQMLQQGAGYDIYMGLFDFLKATIGTIPVLGLNVLSGLIYTVGFWWLARKKKIADELILFSGAAIASSFWFYRQAHDLIILAIPALLAYIVLGKNLPAVKLTVRLTLAAILFCVLPIYATPILIAPAVQNFLIMLAPYVGDGIGQFNRWYTVERLVVAGVGIWLIAKGAETLVRPALTGKAIAFQSNVV